ncbi:MAG: hypothetical protein RL336_1303, partial [Pseudomonadota bacterium]
IVRSIDEGGAKHTATGFGAAAKIKLGQDDIRMQLNVGEWGRYIGAGQGFELADFDGDGTVEMDSTTSYTIAYRHVMGDGWRTNVYYGGLEGDESDRSRSHFGANIMTTLAPGLTGGLEVGRFSISDGDSNLDSKYLQLMVKLGL